MARKRNAVDLACEEWAVPMRELLGAAQPKLAKDYLGPVRCTLAARRDLHHGARSGRVEQHFPEYPFRGTAALVNTVYRRMPEPIQEIMVAHYVALTPRSKTLRADLMGISVRDYWNRLGRAKSAVDGALAIVETVCTI
jgi:hypothetical protein